MQIKELAAATGVDAETIRFYEKEGLLPQPARLANGYRNYAPAHLERLSAMSTLIVRLTLEALPGSPMADSSLPWP